MPPPSSAYAVENFESPPDEELICSVCRCVFNDPVECPCRHVFCRGCITSWLERKKNCPVCRKRVLWSDLHPVVPIITNMISKLRLNCPNVELGCLDKISLEGYDNHLKVCKFELEECKYPKCRQKFIRASIENHEKRECKYRLVRCRRECKLLISFYKIRKHNCVTELRKLLNARKRENEMLKKQNAELQEKCKNLERDLREVRTRVRRNSPILSSDSNSHSIFSSTNSVGYSSDDMDVLNFHESSSFESISDDDDDDWNIEDDWTSDPVINYGGDRDFRNVLDLLFSHPDRSNRRRDSGSRSYLSLSQDANNAQYNPLNLSVRSEGQQMQDSSFALNDTSHNEINNSANSSSPVAGSPSDNNETTNQQVSYPRFESGSNVQVTPLLSNTDDEEMQDETRSTRRAVSDSEPSSSGYQRPLNGGNSSTDSYVSTWSQKRKRRKLVVSDSSETDENHSAVKICERNSLQDVSSPRCPLALLSRCLPVAQENVSTSGPSIAVNLPRSTEIAIEVESSDAQAVITGPGLANSSEQQNGRSQANKTRRRMRQQNNSPERVNTTVQLPRENTSSDSRGRNSVRTHGDTDDHSAVVTRQVSSHGPDDQGNAALETAERRVANIGRSHRWRQGRQNSGQNIATSDDVVLNALQTITEPVLPRTVELLSRYSIESDPDWEPGVDSSGESEESNFAGIRAQSPLDGDSEVEDAYSVTSSMWDSDSSYEVEVPERTWDLLMRYSAEPSDEDQDWEPPTVI